MQLLAGDGSIVTADSEFAQPAAARVTVEWVDVADIRTAEQIVEFISYYAPAFTQVIQSELTELLGLSTAQLARIAQGIDVLREFARADEDTEDDEPETSDIGNAPDAEIDQEEADDDVDLQSDFIPNDVRAQLKKPLTPSDDVLLRSRLTLLRALSPEILRQLSPQRLQSVFGEVVEELKPGLIIDGQHRVSATRDLGRIPFLVACLPFSAWPELAFQFIVTNHTAKAVPENLLISIVGNSLTKEQRQDLEVRLREAHIRVGLIEAIMTVQEDPFSPFRGMIKFGLPNEGGIAVLDATAMLKKVVKPWFERDRYRERDGIVTGAPVKELFDHFCVGRTARERKDDWKNRALWLDFFSRFWGTVRKRYDNTQVFSTETVLSGPNRVTVSKMMRSTVLGVFQETVLQVLYEDFLAQGRLQGKNIPELLEKPELFDEYVYRLTAPVVPEFFQGWTMTGLDASKEVRGYLAQALREMIRGKGRGEELTKLRKESPLFNTKRA